MVMEIREFEPQPDGSLSASQMEYMIRDLRYEPAWRDEAAREAAFYDGDQLDQPTLAIMRRQGMSPQIINEIKPAINSVINYRGQNMRDLMVVAEDDESTEGAEALNQKFKESLRLTEFHDVCERSELDGWKVGIGWAEVSMEKDPWGYSDRVLYVPWREMYWDPRARDPMLKDSRFFLRRKFYDLDEIQQHFPHEKEMLSFVQRGFGNGWLGTGTFEQFGGSGIGSRHGTGRNTYFWNDQSTQEEKDWYMSERGRVPLYEIHYWMPGRVVVMELVDGRKMEFQQQNPLHHEAVRQGAAVLREGPTRNYRKAYYVGGHRIHDEATGKTNSHYVPFIGYLEDGTGKPYGLIRDMMSPQEEINARHTRILSQQATRQHFVDEDAVDDHAQTAKELGRPDAYIKLKADRQGDRGIHVESNSEVSQINFALLQQSHQDVVRVTGLGPNIKGQSHGANQSGVAFQEEVEQSGGMMAHIEKNFDKARVIAGRMLLGQIVERHQNQNNMKVPIEKSANRPGRTVTVNGTMPGKRKRNNDLMQLRTRVALSEVPMSLTYRHQVFFSLIELTKSLPPEIQAAMTDMVVMASNHPQRDEIVDRIRQITGFGPEPSDPQEAAALRQQQEQQQAIEHKMLALDIANQAADERLKTAKAILEEVKAMKLIGPDTEHTEAKTAAALAGVGQGAADQRRKAVETEGNLIAAEAKLRDTKNKALQPGRPQG